MRVGIVEGEPGIFPDPIARILRKLGGLFGKERAEEPAEERPERPEPEEDPTKEP